MNNLNVILKCLRDCRRVLSKTSQLSQSSSLHEGKPTKKKDLMSEHAELSHEIKALKEQIQHLKSAISSLQQDTEKKEVR